MAGAYRRPLLERLGKEWLFFDGGTGTILQEKGLQGGELPERWNLTRPEDIIDLHCGYLRAGCDIFNTNTFGANALKFPDEGELRAIVEAAVSLAQEARRRTGREDAYIALDLGPTGRPALRAGRGPLRPGRPHRRGGRRGPGPDRDHERQL